MCEKYFRVAAYIRLSREDGDKAESDSVTNQKKLILDFLNGKEKFVIYDTYIDDGFSGTNFRRPAFTRLIRDIEEGYANCVIVKDLSRFGRDYIETGRYLERFFPERGVRFISITDNIDSEKQIYDMLLPIRNIFNEQYARDISQKIHASLQTKQKAGEFIGAFAPYGYRKAPDNKNKLVVDEYAAEIVRKIFDLFLQGYGKIRIAGMLNEEGISCPAEYKKQNGYKYRNSKIQGNISCWTYTTINRILRNEMYIGNMVQGRKYQRMRSRAKLKKREDWIVVEGTHEAIIDRDTWERVQELLESEVQKENRFMEKGLFSGILRCSACNCALVKKTGARSNSERKQKIAVRYYCGTYVRSGHKFCTPHSISQTKLETEILEDVRKTVGILSDISCEERDKIRDSVWFRQLSEIEKNGKLSRENMSGVISRIIVSEKQEIEIVYRLPDEMKKYRIL